MRPKYSLAGILYEHDDTETHKISLIETQASICRKVAGAAFGVVQQLEKVF